MNGFNLIIKPDAVDTEAAEVFVDGSIGAKHYRFLLDTGAARTYVQHDAYTATFDSIETHHSSGVFAKSSDDVIVVPSLLLGPIAKQNVPVARAAKDSPDAKNLIGMDLLKDYCLHFYFDQNRVSVYSKDECEGAFALHDLYVDQKFHPYIDIWFGAVRATTVWDTGAGITVADMNFIRKYPALFQEAGHSHGTDSTGHTMETPMFTMASTVIGNHEFPPHKVAGVDLSHVNATIETPMDLILGYSTLSHANWLFNFPRKRWAVTKMLSNSFSAGT